jgi:hypothetical protein
VKRGEGYENKRGTARNVEEEGKRRGRGTTKSNKW